VWAVEPAVGCAAECSCCVDVQVAYLLLLLLLLLLLRLCFRLMVHEILRCLVHLLFLVLVAAVAQEYTSAQEEGGCELCAMADARTAAHTVYGSRHSGRALNGAASVYV
jgi:hypothetical protein